MTSITETNNTITKTPLTIYHLTTAGTITTFTATSPLKTPTMYSTITKFSININSTKNSTFVTCKNYLINTNLSKIKAGNSIRTSKMQLISQFLLQAL